MELCARLAATAWPVQRPQRQALLRRMDALAGSCSSSASFLGLLGALWLEEGEPAQALIWLERSLLLDPGALGVQADHALALAAMGEPAARRELAERWAARADVPPPLRARLSDHAAAVRSATAGTNGRRWLQRGELQLRAGYDSNLDRSPILDGITLTDPDGPIELPLAIPQRPRKGDATLIDASWRIGLEAADATLWQWAAAASARRSQQEPGTDWHHLQFRGEHWRSWDGWRIQALAGWSLSGGPLDEPYTLRRLGAAVERDRGRCTLRSTGDFEMRRYRRTGSLDGNVSALSVGGHCLIAEPTQLGAWSAGAELRASIDRPDGIGRPGGSQRQWGGALKLSGLVGQMRIEASLSLVRSRDDEGYSKRLEFDARRAFTLAQGAIDLSWPVRSDWARGDLVAQLSTTRQRSNLPLFTYKGSNAYLGWRWHW